MNDVLTTLGLARRAGKVILGADAVCALASPPPLVLTAADASDRVRRALRSVGMRPLASPWSMADLGHAVGCGNVAVLAVTENGFADMIRRKMEQQEENA